MSTAVLAVSGLLAPLQAMSRWLLTGKRPATWAAISKRYTSGDRSCFWSAPHLHATPSGAPSASAITAEVAPDFIAKCPMDARANQRFSSQGSSARPLRVMRLLETGQAPTSVGRMVMSGRMADVCAELDRLVAREAALS